VERKAECDFIRNTANYNLVPRNWNTYYWVRCWEVSTFWELAHDSMKFVAGQVEAIDRVDIPATPSIGTKSARLSSVHYLPESPSSN